MAILNDARQNSPRNVVLFAPRFGNRSRTNLAHSGSAEDHHELDREVDRTINAQFGRADHVGQVRRGDDRHQQQKELVDSVIKEISE